MAVLELNRKQSGEVWRREETNETNETNETTMR